MISAINGSSGWNTSEIASKLFKRLDTNGDNGIDVTELQSVAAGTNIDSSQLIASLDTDSNGTIDTAELESALEKISGGSSSRGPQGPGGMKPPDPSKMFAKADANGDGVIDKDEFAAMAPPDADSSMSDEIFASIDTDGNGTIDETENAAAMEKMGPPPPPPPPDETDATQQASGTGAITSADSANSTLAKILEALQNSSSEDDDESSEKTMRTIARLVSDLQNGTTYGKLGTSVVSTSGATNLFTASA